MTSGAPETPTGQLWKGTAAFELWQCDETGSTEDFLAEEL